MTPLGLGFGAAAEAYHQHRPGYPAQVGDAVLAYAERPIRAALEIGAGTGKATRLLAERGGHVTALEPDPEMAAVLRRCTVGLPVEAVVTTFEDYRSARRFDLVFCAAAWHWTDPVTRWTRSAERLAPRGTLAVFGVPGDLADPRVAAAVDAIERRFLGPEVPGRRVQAADELTDDSPFTDVQSRRFPRRVECAPEDYVDRLGTVSRYLALAAPIRADALRSVREVLPRRVAVDESTELLLARRREAR